MSNAYPSKALIVDDEKTNRLILKSLLKKQNYECIEAANGKEAIDLFRAEQPSIIFMDVMMPVVDGYEATRQIKAEAGGRFVPIIFLTAITDESALARCIDAGGDDVLVKPYDSFILTTKIRAMRRIATLNRQVQGMYSMIHREQEIAESVFTNAIQGANVKNPYIKSVIRPASTFSGDMMLSAYSPSRDLIFMIGDFTGHGLASALGAMPVSEVFHAMVAKGFSIEEVLIGINKKLKFLLPTGMFFGVLIVVIDHEFGHARVYNAGMPDLLVVDGATNQVIHRVKSSSLPLGILPEINMQGFVRYISVNPNDKLILFSDGLIEARNARDEEFGEPRLLRAIGKAATNDIYQQIIHDLDLFCGDKAQADDVTLVELTCVSELVPKAEVAEHHHERKAHSHVGEWTLSLTFSGVRLRETNPVPILVNQILEMEDLEDERQSLFTVITELYVNALDHGVLGLDSKLKSDSSGFARYFRTREERLAELDSGYIHFQLIAEQSPGSRCILVKVEDSGEGFDYKNYRPIEDDTTSLSGRGIMVIKELCESLKYEGKGNIAEACYRWSTD